MMVHFPKDVRNRLCLSHQKIERISTTQNHREYWVFLHRILPYSWSPYTMNTGKLFKKYTETIFNRILSKYWRIRCKKTPYSPVFGQNTVEYSFCIFFEYFPVFIVQGLREYGRIRCKKTRYSQWFCVVQNNRHFNLIK